MQENNKDTSIQWQSYADFRGKVVVVTGAAGGIGRALVESFVAHGLRVVALDVQEAGVVELQTHHGNDRVLGLRCDVSDPADCKRQIRAAQAQFGDLHMLVNNAALGMNSASHDYAPGRLVIDDIREEVWQRFMAVNVNGPFFMAKAMMPDMLRQKWGRIINVSTSFLTMMRPGFYPYGPSKAALESWSLILARELMGSGITVNVVLPGAPTDTPMVPDQEGRGRDTLLSPVLMALPMLGLFTDNGDCITGRRFLAVDWDPMKGTDPSLQHNESAAWPSLARDYGKQH